MLPCHDLFTFRAYDGREVTRELGPDKEMHEQMARSFMMQWDRESYCLGVQVFVNDIEEPWVDVKQEDLEFHIHGDTLKIKRIMTTKYMGNDAMAVVVVVEWPDGSPEMLKLSLNFDHGQKVFSKDLPEGDFFVKNYVEGVPLFNAMVRFGIIEPTGAEPVKSGHVECPIYRLTKAGKLLAEELSYGNECETKTD